MPSSGNAKSFKHKNQMRLSRINQNIQKHMPRLYLVLHKKKKNVLFIRMCCHSTSNKQPTTKCKHLKNTLKPEQAEAATLSQKISWVAAWVRSTSLCSSKPAPELPSQRMMLGAIVQVRNWPTKIRPRSSKAASVKKQPLRPKAISTCTCTSHDTSQHNQVQ